MIDNFFQTHIAIGKWQLFRYWLLSSSWNIKYLSYCIKEGWQGLVVDIDDYKLELFKRRRGKNVEGVKGAISSRRLKIQSTNI